MNPIIQIRQCPECLDYIARTGSRLADGSPKSLEQNLVNAIEDEWRHTTKQGKCLHVIATRGLGEQLKREIVAGLHG